MLQGKGSGPKGLQKLLDSMGGGQISDPVYLGDILDKVIANNQKQLEQYRGGKTKLKGHFVGWGAFCAPPMFCCMICVLFARLSVDQSWAIRAIRLQPPALVAS